MQEEVESRTVTLAISTTRMTANVLKSAISKYLAYRKEKKVEKARAGPVKPCGKQTVKQLVGQNEGVANIEITDKNIRDFDRHQIPDDLAHQDREPCAHSSISFLPGSGAAPAAPLSAPRRETPKLQECLHYIKNTERLQGKQRQNS